MKYLSSLVGAFLICASAHAAAPTKESVERLLRAVGSEKLLNTMQQQVEGMTNTGMDQAFKDITATPKAQKLAESLRTKIVAELRADMSWDKMKDIYIQAYTENFTQEEINGLITFYESPTGVAFATKMPAVLQKSTAMMQERLGPMMQKMQQSVQQAVQEIRAIK